MCWGARTEGGGNARTLTFLVVKNPEGISILVSEELTNNNIRIFLYQPVISKMSRYIIYKWELQVSRVIFQDLERKKTSIELEEDLMLWLCCSQ